MLKKLLKPATEKTIFPISTSVEGANRPEITNIQTIAETLMANEEFASTLKEAVIHQILEILLDKYNFEPSDKYKQEIENKKQYINQLDAYLNERKQINQAVENDLQQFLNETTENITKALEAFSAGIQSRIADAENRYGIDQIKQLISGVKENV